MQGAGATGGTQARAAAWAKIDRMLTPDAVAIPWAFGKGAQIESADVPGINDLWNQGLWDYNYTSRRWPKRLGVPDAIPGRRRRSLGSSCPSAAR
jgi:hypothetical protein